MTHTNKVGHFTSGHLISGAGHLIPCSLMYHKPSVLFVCLLKVLNWCILGRTIKVAKQHFKITIWQNILNAKRNSIALSVIVTCTCTRTPTLPPPGGSIWDDLPPYSMFHNPQRSRGTLPYTDSPGLLGQVKGTTKRFLILTFN